MIDIYNIGLLIMRGQPFHIGHARTLIKAIEICDKVVVALGSVQEHGTSKNPCTFLERKRMIKNYCLDKVSSLHGTYWENVTIIGLRDINDAHRWPDYVFEEVHMQTGYIISTLFGGTSYDCHWFKNTGIDIEIVDRTDPTIPFVSGSMVREMLLYGDKRWMDYIPKCNWHMVAKKFNRLEMLNAI